jgi:hypothetical protein
MARLRARVETLERMARERNSVQAALIADQIRRAQERPLPCLGCFEPTASHMAFVLPIDACRALGIVHDEKGGSASGSRWGPAMISGSSGSRLSHEGAPLCPAGTAKDGLSFSARHASGLPSRVPSSRGRHCGQ